jgi:3-polyprenyl-4-hydroxybenzoate decarboxylase
MTTRLDPTTGVITIPECFGHGLSPSFPDHKGGKIGFDCTRPFPSPPNTTAPPARRCRSTTTGSQAAPRRSAAHDESRRPAAPPHGAACDESRRPAAILVGSSRPRSRPRRKSSPDRFALSPAGRSMRVSPFRPPGGAGGSQRRMDDSVRSLPDCSILMPAAAARPLAAQEFPGSHGPSNADMMRANG